MDGTTEGLIEGTFTIARKRRAYLHEDRRRGGTSEQKALQVLLSFLPGQRAGEKEKSRVGGSISLLYRNAPSTRMRGNTR